MDNTILINLIFAIVAIFLVALIVYIKGFKNWLVWAVTEAEAELGSGTGQLKLRYVYDLAVSRFPMVAKLIPFTIFSKWVDNALAYLKQMITDNKKIENWVKNK